MSPSPRFLHIEHLWKNVTATSIRLFFSLLLPSDLIMQIKRMRVTNVFRCDTNEDQNCCQPQNWLKQCWNFVLVTCVRKQSRGSVTIMCASFHRHAMKNRARYFYCCAVSLSNPVMHNVYCSKCAAIRIPVNDGTHRIRRILCNYCS